MACYNDVYTPSFKIEWFLRIFKIQSKKQIRYGEKDKNSGKNYSGEKIKIVETKIVEKEII
jgi:hypothetical protein